jgi:hypothetical protein
VRKRNAEYVESLDKRFACTTWLGLTAETSGIATQHSSRCGDRDDLGFVRQGNASDDRVVLIEVKGLCTLRVDGPLWKPNGLAPAGDE